MTGTHPLAQLNEMPTWLPFVGDNHDKWSPPDISAVAGTGSCGFQMYRISADIAPQFYSTMWNLQAMLPYANVSRPGCWSYPDVSIPALPLRVCRYVQL